MTNKKKEQSQNRFEREAYALQKNLSKRKLQQEALNKIKQKEIKDHGQTQN